MTAPIETGGDRSGPDRMPLPAVLYARHAEWSRSVAGDPTFSREGQLWSRVAEVTR
jgi:hypothetical protein